LLSNYGWANPKREKDVQKDDEFWIFKGRRKEEGPFGEEYNLAWLSKFGLVKFKHIDLTKDGYEEEFFRDYTARIDFYRNNEDKKANTAEIFKFTKDNKGIKLFIELLNMGTLSDYLSRRHLLGKTLTEKAAIPMLENFVTTMRALEDEPAMRAHGSLHSKILYVHNHRIVLGEPLLVTDKIEKKLRELKTTFDYYAPEMKENIILPENLFKLDFKKMDMWSFGFILHKVITRELPTFDPTRRPSLNARHFSPGMHDLIVRCLSLTPAHRPKWEEINLSDLEVGVVAEVEEAAPEKEVVRLGTSKEKSSIYPDSRKGPRYESIKEEEVINVSEHAHLQEKVVVE
jgi:serine/threonine protein kinase